MRIALIDDHGLFLEGLGRILNDHFGDIEFLHFVRPDHFLDSYRDSSDYDLVVTDVEMPQMTGPELIMEMRKIRAGQKVLVVSMYENHITLSQLMSLGINGYLFKNSTREQIYGAVTEILKGNTYFPEEVLEILKEDDTQNNSNPLTKRELEIVKLLAEGRSSQDIATALFLSKYTVDTHKKNILNKINAKNVAELIVWAVRNNILKL